MRSDRVSLISVLLLLNAADGVTESPAESVCALLLEDIDRDKVLVYSFS